jgi:hypothetical protein
LKELQEENVGVKTSFRKDRLFLITKPEKNRPTIVTKGPEHPATLPFLTFVNPHMIPPLAVNLKVFVAKVTLEFRRYVDMFPNHVTLERFQRLKDLPTVPTHHLAVFVRPLLVQLHGRFTLERAIANFAQKRTHRRMDFHVGLQ